MKDYKIAIKKIIKEVIEKLFEDYNEDLFDEENYLKQKIFDDFFSRKEKGYTRVPWRLIPYELLEITWNKYVELGYFHERYLNNLEKIENIMTENILKLKILTDLSGHSSSSYEEDFDDAGIIDKRDYENSSLLYIKDVADVQQLKLFDGDYTKFKLFVYDKDENLIDSKVASNESELNKMVDFLTRHYLIKDIISDNNFFDKEKDDFKLLNQDVKGFTEDFYDWTVDAEGTDIMSDYGLEPLLKLLHQLRSEEEKTPEERLLIIDQMLNVAHQRSDLASWFVVGGSRALNKLAGN
jgi:hypothetical protein